MGLSKLLVGTAISDVAAAISADAAGSASRRLLLGEVIDMIQQDPIKCES